ncbi:hypothetical protein BH10ACI4_BH10ACI4_06190 [soil metagenome]
MQEALPIVADDVSASMTLFRRAASNDPKVHTSAMGFRVTLASFLTAIMLCVSSLASTCEIKCELAETLPSCHGSSRVKTNAQPAMAEMPGMELEAAPGTDAEATTLVALAPACKVHACAQQPAFFSEQKAALTHVLVSTGAVSVGALQFAPEPLNAGFSSRGPPHLRPHTPITLRTTLRV